MGSIQSVECAPQRGGTIQRTSRGCGGRGQGGVSYKSSSTSSFSHFDGPPIRGGAVVDQYPSPSMYRSSFESRKSATPPLTRNGGYPTLSPSSSVRDYLRHVASIKKGNFSTFLQGQANIKSTMSKNQSSRQASSQGATQPGGGGSSQKSGATPMTASAASRIQGAGDRNQSSDTNKSGFASRAQSAAARNSNNSQSK
ncbi:hypothetical protein BGZ83_000559 [Gryganskiella cystojenkinii]|nr:hypothetical protein BGZ83_000556 [Gryganskiella cystojenkinii]KAG0042361.1 hypothetical protein BGZ83_000559 [Gryganskiella cystojenkinii]